MLIIFIMMIHYYYIILFLTSLFTFTNYELQHAQLINPAYAFQQIQDKNIERQLTSTDPSVKEDILIHTILPILTGKLTDIEKNISSIRESFEPNKFVIEEFPVPSGSHPHDVAPATDGTIWYTAQGSGELGQLDPSTGDTYHIHLGNGSAPHGVIVGPDGAPWITDGGLNAIVRVDPSTKETKIFSLPADNSYANLNTATFDQSGILWFTGQNGIYGRLDPTTGHIKTFASPKGPGPYGISTTPDGDVYFASLAGSYIARIDLETGNVTVLEPPTPDQGARRVWSDSINRIWVSEWDSGKLGVYDPDTKTWKEWQLPGENPLPYAVYVDEHDKVWISDFASNSFLRFDPMLESFKEFKLPSKDAKVRQILGSPEEVWGAESGTDKLVRVQKSD
jgi:virginiamycin B lyase